MFSFRIMLYVLACFQLCCLFYHCVQVVCSKNKSKQKEKQTRNYFVLAVVLKGVLT